MSDALKYSSFNVINSNKCCLIFNKSAEFIIPSPVESPAITITNSLVLPYVVFLNLNPVPTFPFVTSSPSIPNIFIVSDAVILIFVINSE